MALLEAACEIENNVEAGLVYVTGQTQCCVGRMGFRVGGSARASFQPRADFLMRMKVLLLII